MGARAPSCNHEPGKGTFLRERYSNAGPICDSALDPDGPRLRGVRPASIARRREAQTRTWFAGIWRDFQPALSKRKPQERQPWRCSYNRGGWRCTSSQSKSLSFPWIRAVDKTLVLPVQGKLLGWYKRAIHPTPLHHHSNVSYVPRKDRKSAVQCASLYLHKIMLLPMRLPRGTRHFIREKRAISSFLDDLE